MIKKILKFILPPVTLKKAFLFYNSLRIKTIDRFLYRTYSVRNENFFFEQKKNPFLELNIPVDQYPESIKHGLRLWTDPDWTQDEYFLFFNSPGFIEPNTGWGMTIKKRLILQSLGFSKAPYVRKPSVADLYWAKKKVLTLDRIISLRDTGEENFFHFFIDVIPKLFFTRDKGYDVGTFSIVVSEKLFQKPYFKKALEHEWFKKLNWHVQKDEWIKFNTAVFCKPYTHSIKYLLEVKDTLRTNSTPDAGRRIFLTRPASSLRYVENMAALKPVLDRHDFEIFDSSNLDFTSHIELFAASRYVVSIHGAGLTNILFRHPRHLGILELFHPFEYIPFHYMMLARQLNFEYDLIVGEKGRQYGQGGFLIDPVKFDVALRKLIGQ